MTKIEANVPDYLAKQAFALAERENVPVDQIVALALSAQLAAWKGSDDMATRARRADSAKFDRIMSRVPDVPPMPGDELPEGYQRSR
ncbi:MAG: hypothetical protein AB1705_07025 [Verrucomicrobiota bacterium]